MAPSGEVDLGLVIVVAGGASTLGTAVIGWLFRSLFISEKNAVRAETSAATTVAANTKTATDKKAAECDAAILLLEREHHKLELSLGVLRGEHALVRQRSDELTNDVRDIKEQMVSRQEWEAHAKRVDSRLDTILLEIRRSPGRYSSPPRGFEMVEAPRPDPKAPR